MRWLAVLFSILFGAQLVQGRESVTSEGAGRLYKLIQWPTKSGPYIKFGRPVPGFQATITVAFVNQTTPVEANAGDCNSLEPLTQLVETAGVNESDFKREVIEGLRVWEKVSGVRFVVVDDPRLARVLIGASTEPKTVTHGRVSLNLSRHRSEEMVSLRSAAICLDVEEPWTLDPAHRVIGEEKFISVRMVIAHEAGHVLGLGHPVEKGHLMSPAIVDGMSGLTDGDVRGAVFLYGRPRGF